MSPLLAASHIGKSFHLLPVLKDLSLAVDTGETVFLFGRNGSGKTTLLKILAGVMRPEKGAATLNDRPLFTADSRWRRDMVYLGHRPCLYPAFTARENLMLSVRLRREAWDEAAFQSLLEVYGLKGREDDPVGVYSEGMLQRLGLIRIELASWRMALLDEPAAALDVDGAALLGETLHRWRELGRSILFTSHDMAWGTAHTGRAVLLRRGIIAEDIPAPEKDRLVSLVSARA